MATGQAGESSALGVDRKSGLSAVGILRMMSEHFASGARKSRTEPTNQTQVRITIIPISAKAVAHKTEAEGLHDRHRQEAHSLRPRPLADRVAQLPMDLVKRMPLATHRCMSQHPANKCQTQCILQV